MEVTFVGRLADIEGVTIVVAVVVVDDVVVVVVVVVECFELENDGNVSTDGFVIDLVVCSDRIFISRI